MNLRTTILTVGALALILFLASRRTNVSSRTTEDKRIASFVADPAVHTMAMFWRDSSGTPYRNIGNLRSHLEAHGHNVLMAMNGGMFTPKHTPVGLYIEDGKTLSPINTASGRGNFYLKPNGIFYINSEGRPGICVTDSATAALTSPAFATQSGPMLVIDGDIHPTFRQGSTNLNIRNGVGILPDGKALFAISNEAINLYDFARFFQQKGCRQALYLDGFVSRAYLQGQLSSPPDGDFAVMIAVY
jgi:uncharacterized protein YigE (DUF2233 family)